MKRQLARTVLWFCILLFFAIWYQIISKIACNFVCQNESEQVQEEVVDYENMSPEELKAAFLILQKEKQQ
tara:strand:- start:289 stop:498 length:210 start_codon:yes stop_codon:yes gene_type:complete